MSASHEDSTIDLAANSVDAWGKNSQPSKNWTPWGFLNLIRRSKVGVTSSLIL